MEGREAVTKQERKEACKKLESTLTHMIWSCPFLVVVVVLNSIHIEVAVWGNLFKLKINDILYYIPKLGTLNIFEEYC